MPVPEPVFGSVIEPVPEPVIGSVIAPEPQPEPEPEPVNVAAHALVFTVATRA